jgi:diacylglycerol kinase family enzyme
VKVTLIHNPQAGGTQPDRPMLEKLVREAGHEPRYQSCREKDWLRILDAPADVVAVAGGDGTLARVAKRMLGRGVPIAALPLGTANNISKSLGATDLSLEQLIASWEESRRLRFDAGVVTGPWGRRHFIEGVGMGLFAWTLPQADASDNLARLEATEDKLVYALQMLKDRLQHCPSMEVRGSLDGRDVSGSYIMLEALNIPYVGPNLFLAPHGDFSDGCLDIALVNEAEREHLFTCLTGWQRGSACRPDLPIHSGRHLQLEWSGFPIHIDDEVWPAEDEKPAAKSATIDVRIASESVEFLEPGLPVGF